MPILKLVRQILVAAARIVPHLGLVFRRNRRFLILDPFLTSPVSHNLNFDLGFRAALESKAWSVTVLANRYAYDRVIREAKAHRLFASPGYVDFSPFNEMFQLRNGDFHRDMCRFNFARFGADNIILLHTITAFELFGLARWYRDLPEDNRPCLIVYIQLGAAFGLHDKEEIAGAVSAYRSVALSLSRFPKVVLCTSSPRLLELFPAGTISARLFPFPMSWPAPLPPRANDQRIVFGYIGGLRRVKGFHLLAQAVVAVLEAVPNADFIINSPYNPEFADEISRLGGMGGRVQMRNSPPGSRAEYYKLFGEVDVVLNAYDPAQYEEATSMICLEAIGMGRGLITTAGTWAAETAKQLDAANVSMKDFSSESLVAAIADYLARHAELKEKAGLAQKRVREHHNVDAFLAATALPPLAGGNPDRPSLDGLKAVTLTPDCARSG